MNTSIKLVLAHNKFLVALLGAVLTVVAQQYGTNPKVQMVLALVTALGVYGVPNVKQENVPMANSKS